MDNKAPRLRIGVSTKTGGLLRASHAFSCPYPHAFAWLYRISGGISFLNMISAKLLRPFTLQCRIFPNYEILIS
ncbi:MAG: hypothetical protein RR855_15580 [Comamonas sp.]